MSDKPILRAQACRFRRRDFTLSKRGKDIKDWEPGIAFLVAFGVSEVEFIIDAQGEKVHYNSLYDYNLLQLRVDGYIAIESYDYAGKESVIKTDDIDYAARRQFDYDSQGDS